MKLGNAIFYTIESKRQKMLQATEAWPYLGGFFSIFYFAYFAVVTPLSRKLYKEAGMSVILGLLTALPMVYYYRSGYLKEVDLQYHALK
jgi:hypothetical protein